MVRNPWRRWCVLLASLTALGSLHACHRCGEEQRPQPRLQPPADVVPRQEPAPDAGAGDLAKLDPAPTLAPAPPPAPPQDPARMHGVVAYKGEPASGASVFFYRDGKTGFRGVAAYQTDPSRSDGRFELEVPPGTYYAVARRGTSGDLFAFYGGNPIHVASREEAWVQLVLARTPKAPPPGTAAPQQAASGLRGRAYSGRDPLPGAELFAYPQAPRPLTGEPAGRARTDSQGRFVLPLPAGEYFVTGQRRRRPHASGPLDVGDHFCYVASSPVRVVKGELADVAAACVRRPLMAPQVGREHILLSGSVLDEAGAPVSGVIVGVYGTSSMTGKPAYTSSPTRADGTFELQLLEPGRYYPAARTRFDGPPLSGEIYGVLRGQGTAGVEVAGGQRTAGLVFVARPVP